MIYPTSDRFLTEQVVLVHRESFVVIQISLLSILLFVIMLSMWLMVLICS